MYNMVDTKKNTLNKHKYRVCLKIRFLMFPMQLETSDPRNGPISGCEGRLISTVKSILCIYIYCILSKPTIWKLKDTENSDFEELFLFNHGCFWGICEKLQGWTCLMLENLVNPPSKATLKLTCKLQFSVVISNPQQKLRISNYRTHCSRTPKKPEYPIARSQLTW